MRHQHPGSTAQAGSTPERGGFPSLPGDPPRPVSAEDNPGAQGFLIAERAEDLVAEVMSISGVEARIGEATFTGQPRHDAGVRFALVETLLYERGFAGTLTDGDGGRAEVKVSLLVPEPDVRSNPLLHLALLAATLGTTIWAGALHQGVNLLQTPNSWSLGLPYAVALLAVLGIHEMGHYVVARRRGVRVTLPYFIPAPIFLGTFGAFIRMGSIRDRATAFDVAFAGPLAGLVVAVLALLYGIATGDASTGHGMDPRSSVLVFGAYSLLGGSASAGLIELGPVGFAGWLGLLVTALNLTPVGQLDGGHIAYAVLGGRRAATLSAMVIGLLVAAGLFYSPHWLMWALIIWAIAGTRHPPVRNELAPLGTGRVVFAGLSFALLLAIVLPWGA
jgi:membrane-associated protease RseP (regulator of RpoE activity)